MKLFGNCGELDASKILRKLAFHIFTAELLSDFTWTGKTNKRGVRKFAIKDYKLLLSLIYETLHAADSSYTKGKFEEEFVAKVMKYAYIGKKESKYVILV